MSVTYHKIADATIILRAKGVYKQVAAYQRNGRLYAGWGTGFIGVKRLGTTLPDVVVDEMELPDGVTVTYGDHDWSQVSERARGRSK